MFTEGWQRGLLRRGIGVADRFAEPHGFDRYLEQLAPRWSSTEVRGRVTHVERQGSSSVVLTIEANRNWTGFRPGQHTELTVEIDGVRHTRCYSMASAAGHGRVFQLGVKAQPEGLVSRYLVGESRVGMTLSVRVR